mgnify:FL=1
MVLDFGDSLTFTHADGRQDRRPADSAVAPVIFCHQWLMQCYFLGGSVRCPGFAAPLLCPHRLVLCPYRLRV